MFGPPVRLLALAALPEHDDEVAALPEHDDELPVQLPDDPVTLPVREPVKVVAVTDARPLRAPDELSAISSAYASAVVLLPNDNPPPPLPYWLMKYDFPLVPSRFHVNQVPCTFVADDEAMINDLLALNVPETLRLLLIVVEPPKTVSPFDNTETPMTFRSFDRLTVLLKEAIPETTAFPDTFRLLESIVVPPKTVRPFDKVEAPRTFKYPEALRALLNDALPATYDAPETTAFPDTLRPLESVVPPVTFNPTK